MRIIIAFIYLLIEQSAASQLTDPYAGQTRPGTTPVLFAYGLVNDMFGNRDMAIAPDYNEFFFTLQNREIASVILSVRKVNGIYQQPEVAPFSGMYNDLEPAFSPDGTKLFFTSNRPLNTSDSTADYNIWVSTKSNNEWLPPIPLDAPVNTERDEFYPSVNNKGDIFFTTALPGGKGKEDIVVCRCVNGQFQPPESLPAAINSPGYEFNAFVHPSENYIIFTAYGRSDDKGKGDLYISLKQNGIWLPAHHIECNVNSAAIDYCPFVTPDGEYLFFTSARVDYKMPFDKPLSLSDFKVHLQSTGNGNDDIYWLSIKEILQQVKK